MNSCYVWEYKAEAYNYFQPPYLPSPEGKRQVSVAFPRKGSEDDNVTIEIIEVDSKHQKAFFHNGAKLIRKI